MVTGTIIYISCSRVLICIFCRMMMMMDDDDNDDDDDDGSGIKITQKVNIFRTILLQHHRSNTMRQNMHISKVRSGKE